jgi:putative redox protein
MITATIGKDHYKTEITTESHTIIADEPDEVQGSNLGPSPTEYLGVALASCTAITLRMYADRKAWLVDKIHVHITITKEVDKTIFNREVVLEGALNEEQRQRLLQIANACPVHKILTHPIEINTQLGLTL